MIWLLFLMTSPDPPPTAGHSSAQTVSVGTRCPSHAHPQAVEGPAPLTDRPLAPRTMNQSSGCRLARASRKSSLSETLWDQGTGFLSVTDKVSLSMADEGSASGGPAAWPSARATPCHFFITAFTPLVYGLCMVCSRHELPESRNCVLLLPSEALWSNSWLV